jgi:RimJ/RimL family protein N-acetyltransferase
MEIRTDRLVLREWRTTDVEPFAALSRDPEVMRWYHAPEDPGQAAAFVARCQAHFERYGYGPWAVEVVDGPSFIGFVGLASPRFKVYYTPAVNISWRLGREHWGRGYATEAARAALAHGFDDLQLDEVRGWVALGNEPSRKVMERLGATSDPTDDFDHPLFGPEHPTRRHALYRLRRPALAL